MGDFHHRTNNEVWLSDYLGAAKKKQIRERTAVHRAAVHFIQEIFEGLRTGTLTKRDPPADICDRLPFLRPSQDPSIAKLTVGSIDALFQAVQSSMGTIKHPSLPCTAFSEAAIKCRFFGLHRDPAEEPNSGVFAVVREARGHQATEPLERNLIVRDLLWLHRVGRQVRSKEPVGAYFSTVDNQGYVLDCVDPGINAITVSGLSHDISVGVTDPKPIKLDFRQRRSDFAFQHREALITGETRRMERPGAWKALIIRPDWPDLERVEADLASINDVSNCHAFLSQSGRIGVLYSRHQVEENAPHANNMVARRHAFRGLIYGKDEPHGFSLAHEDRLKFEEAFVARLGSSRPSCASTAKIQPHSSRVRLLINWKPS